MAHSMTFRWLGTAGFIVKADGFEIAFDPFLSRRDPNHTNVMTPKHLANVTDIFIGHGHFDHVFDVPAICGCSNAHVHGSQANLKHLEKMGVESSRLHLADESSRSLSEKLKIYSFKSKHVNFDLPLVASTLVRCGWNCFHLMKLGVDYPKGGVRTYLFETSGKKILFISSAGCQHSELIKYRDLQPDILLLPLQGHSKIQNIGATMASVINPKIIIPHHHDNFYHPLSQNIDLLPFKEDLRNLGFQGKVMELPLFEEAQI